MSWDLWKKSGEYWSVKAKVLSGPAHWFLNAVVLKESQMPKVHCQSFPTREKSNLSWVLYLPTYAYACAHTRAHTHFRSFTCTKNNTVLTRKDRLPLAKDWNCKKNICKCLIIPQFPFSQLPPKAEIDLPSLLPFMYQVFAFFDVLGLLLTGLKITKSCSHLTPRKGILKCKLLRSPQRQQLSYRNLRSVRKTVKIRHWGQEKHCLGIVNHAKQFHC